MPMFEDPERIREIENEMAHTWTKLRAGDTCIIVGGFLDILGKEVTIKFPYWFHEDGEQTYITEQYPMNFKESELKFVKQKLYGYR